MTFQNPTIDAYYKKFLGINNCCLVKDPLSVAAMMISHAPANKKKQLEKVVSRVVSKHMNKNGAPKNDFIIMSQITNDLDTVFKHWCSAKLLKIWKAGKTADWPKIESVASVATDTTPVVVPEKQAPPSFDDASTDEEVDRLIDEEDDFVVADPQPAPPKPEKIVVKRKKVEKDVSKPAPAEIKVPKPIPAEKKKKPPPPDVPQVPIADMTNPDVRDFLLETYDDENGKCVESTEMYSAYRTWCGKNKKVPGSILVFSGAMREIAHIHKKKKGGHNSKTSYYNFVLKSAAPTDD